MQKFNHSSSLYEIVERKGIALNFMINPNMNLSCGFHCDAFQILIRISRTYDSLLLACASPIGYVQSLDYFRKR